MLDAPNLTGSWVEAARGAMPDVARDIIEQIRAEIPEYRDDPTGAVAAETRRTVTEGLRMFTQSISRRGMPSAEQEEIFRRIGRLEARAGRSHDTLQAAYRIASQSIMGALLDWERRFAAPREEIAALSSAVFAFIDHLASLSAEGFADARAGRGDRERARLLAMLVQRGGFSRRSLLALAARVGWPVHDVCQVAELVPGAHLDEDGLSALARELFGEHALAGRVAGRLLVATPHQVDVEALRSTVASIRRAPTVVLGPVVPLTEAASSARLALRTTTLHAVRAGSRAVVIDSAEHLVELLGDMGSDLFPALVRRRLAPLLGLSAAKRVKYGRLLSAWLECGSLRGRAPGVLDKHRQTLRYQATQLEQMFGADLDDRDARLQLMLALRFALPEWEREEAVLQRRVAQREPVDFIPEVRIEEMLSFPAPDKSARI